MRNKKMKTEMVMINNIKFNNNSPELVRLINNRVGREM